MQTYNLQATQVYEPEPTRLKRGSNQPLHAAQIADALLTLRTASAVAGMSPATIYRRASTDPTFPKLVRMGRRCTRIRAGDLTAWLAAKAEAA
jgi:predicted DNA-binding transcriptional regulator AlpA